MQAEDVEDAQATRITGKVAQTRAKKLLQDFHKATQSVSKDTSRVEPEQVVENIELL